MSTIAERPRNAIVPWSLAAVAALSACFWIVLPADRDVADARARVRALDQRADREVQILRQASRPAAGAPETLPRAILAHRTRPQTVLAALQAFARAASPRHVTLASFAPDDATSRANLKGQAVTLTLHGRYGDVLQTVAALSSEAVLFNVRGVALTQAATQMDWGGVDAAVDGVLFSSPDDVSDSEQENQRVPASSISFSALRISHNPFGMQPGPQARIPAPGLAPLPPNAGSGVPRLRAVIEGEPPRALIEIGDRPSIVRVGTHLGFATVTAISASEIRLDDGRVIRLEGAPR